VRGVPPPALPPEPRPSRPHLPRLPPSRPLVPVVPPPLPRPPPGPAPAPQAIEPGSVPAPVAAGRTAHKDAASSYMLEVHCLGILLRRPDLRYQIDRRMQSKRLPRLSPDDFIHSDHQAILRLFQESVEQDMADPQNFVFNSLSLPMMDMADGLLARTEKLDPNDERVLEDLMRGLLTLRRRRIDQEFEYRRYILVEAQEGGDLKATQDAQSVVHLAQARRSIDASLKEYTSRLQTNSRNF